MQSHHTADSIKEMDTQTYAQETSADGVSIKSGWVLARPLPYDKWTLRFKYAWWVFTGKADAVTWIGQKE